MKRKNIILSILLGSLSISASILFALNSNNKQINQASASSSNPVAAGKFYRVTNASDLVSGGNYIIVSENGYAISDVWGNPAALYGSNEGVINSGKGLVTLNNSPASVFGVEQVGDNFAFYTSMSVTGQFKNKVYLAYNDKTYYGDNTFENIASFYGDKTGVDVDRTNEAVWSFRYDEEHGNYLTNVSKGGDLGFTFTYAQRFCRSEGAYRVEIYKEYVSGVNISALTDTKFKTDYIAGEEINLSGLSIDFRSEKHNQVYYYDTNPELFTFDKYANNSTLEVSFMKLFDFNISLNITEVEYYASQVTSPLADYRGQYMLVCDYGRVLDGDNINKSVTVLDGLYGKVKVDHKYEDEVKFIIEKTNGNLYLKNCNGHYLAMTNGIEFTSVKSNTITLEYNQGGIRIKNEDGLYLNFDMSDSNFSLGVKSIDTQEPVFLYKYDLSNDVLNELNTFSEGFLNATMVCDPQGLVNNITSGIWTTQTNNFNNLSNFAQAELINKTYNSGSVSGDVVAEAIQRYDYIVSKYQLTDFINREASGTLQTNGASQYNKLNDIKIFSSNMTILIILVGMAPITSLFVLIVLKKKKTHKC